MIRMFRKKKKIRKNCYWYEDGKYNNGKPYCDVGLEEEEDFNCEGCEHYLVFRVEWVKETSTRRI